MSRIVSLRGRITEGLIPYKDPPSHCTQYKLPAQGRWKIELMADPGTKHVSAKLWIGLESGCEINATIQAPSIDCIEAAATGMLVELADL